MVLAATFGHEAVVALLHEKGVDIHAGGTATYLKDVDRKRLLGEGKWSCTPLVLAVAMGHPGVVRLLLDLGANPLRDVPNHLDYKTLLELAAYKGRMLQDWNLPVMELLIEATRKLQCPDLADQLKQCLYLAVLTQNIPLVELLVKAGAPITWIGTKHDTLGWSLLDVATVYCPIEVTRLLLQNGCMPTIRGLATILIYGKMDMIRLIMQWVNLPDLADDDFSRGTVLAIAAASGCLSLVKDLISRGWGVDGAPVAQSVWPRATVGSPLSQAARRGHTSVVEFLLAHGASPFGSSGDNRNQLPLACAAQSGHLHVVQILLTHETDDQNGLESSLSAAVGSGHADIASLLLDRGADPNMVDFGMPILFSAISHEAVFKVLAERGADLSVRVCGGNNPISSSVVQYGTGGIVRFMRERGINFDHPTYIPEDGGGTFPLLRMLAASNISVVDALVEHGFEPGPDDPDACQALYAAVDEANIPYLRFLLSRGFDPRELGVEANLILRAAAIESPDIATAVLDFLQGEGLDMESQDRDGRTPLLQSLCEHDFYSPQAYAVRRLLSRGANPIFQSERGEYPLMMAASTSRAQTARAVLLEAIEAQNVPFDQLEMQLLEAIKTVELQPADGSLRVLRKLYWRGRYPVGH